MDKEKIPFVSVFILIINVIVFIYLEISGSTYDFEFLFEKGALSVESFFYQKNYYCIITNMFMHSGVEHIAYNMFVLIVVGYYLEKRIGRICYAVMYILSGIFAGAMSLVCDFILNEYTVSVGASGAVYGIIGVFLAVVFLDKELFEEIGLVRICLFLFVSLYCASTQEDVNYVAHIAGFVFGCVVSYVILLIKKIIMKGENGK